jgi:hypothetical protein
VSSEQPTKSRISRPWIRRELILAGVLLPIGFFVLPVAIYFTGQALLGDYSQEGAGAWALVLSPWLGIQLLRLAAIPMKRKRSATPPQRHPDVT